MTFTTSEINERISEFRLKTGHISDNRIDMITQKTSDHISIPLTEGAINILNRYKGKETADGHVFNVPSNQKLNDAIKEAAQAANLDRVIVDTYINKNTFVTKKCAQRESPCAHVF